MRLLLLLAVGKLLSTHPSPLLTSVIIMTLSLTPLYPVPISQLVRLKTEHGIYFNLHIQNLTIPYYTIHMHICTYIHMLYRYRSILMYGFHILVTTLVTHKIQDTQCGFKLFRRDVGVLLFSSIHLHRWAFDIELVLLAER